MIDEKIEESLNKQSVDFRFLRMAINSSKKRKNMHASAVSKNDQKSNKHLNDQKGKNNSILKDVGNAFSYIRTSVLVNSNEIARDDADDEKSSNSSSDSDSSSGSSDSKDSDSDSENDKIDAYFVEKNKKTEIFVKANKLEISAADAGVVADSIKRVGSSLEAVEEFATESEMAINPKPCSETAENAQVTSLNVKVNEDAESGYDEQKNISFLLSEGPDSRSLVDKNIGIPSTGMRPPHYRMLKSFFLLRLAYIYYTSFNSVCLYSYQQKTLIRIFISMT